MPDDRHPLDILAERLEAAADQPVAAQPASPDFWELRSATDQSVGDYPQAVLASSKFRWGDSQGLGPDGFPNVPIPELRLQRRARWTDVLSASLWSDGRVFNEAALAVFKQFDLGNFREYPVTVCEKGAARTLTYLHIRNLVEPAAIDFERSEFYLADILGIPSGQVSVQSFDEWEEKSQQAQEGELDGCEEFSEIDYKQLYFRPGQVPAADYFTLARLGVTVYISARLKDAIHTSGITGLEIRPNRRLFVDH